MRAQRSPTCKVSLSLWHAKVNKTYSYGLGGKGGFGSLLRNQAQTRRKITNWDHSRDLDGRRIGNVKNENSLVDFFKKRREEETKIQAEVEQV